MKTNNYFLDVLITFMYEFTRRMTKRCMTRVPNAFSRFFFLLAGGHAKQNANVIQLEHQAELAIKQLGNALAKMASPESHATAVPKDTNKVDLP